MNQPANPRYRLSALAESDLLEILDYTVDTWGERQADDYLTDLVECFERVARMPSIGRPCDAVLAGFRRLEHQKHVIFYLPKPNGIFISRVLHQQMLVTREMLMEP